MVAKFFKFSFIGGVVFLFDASCFWLFIELFSEPQLARAISVTLAMMLSWWLNSTFTFNAKVNRKSWGQLFKFMLSQLPGAGVNSQVTVFAFSFLPVAMNNPWISVAIGSCAGLVVNFILAHLFVFNKKEAAP